MLCDYMVVVVFTRRPTAVTPGPVSAGAALSRVSAVISSAGLTAVLLHLSGLYALNYMINNHHPNPSPKGTRRGLLWFSRQLHDARIRRVGGSVGRVGGIGLRGQETANPAHPSARSPSRLARLARPSICPRTPSGCLERPP